MNSNKVHDLSVKYEWQLDNENKYKNNVYIGTFESE